MPLTATCIVESTADSLHRCVSVRSSATTISDEAMLFLLESHCLFSKVVEGTKKRLCKTTAKTGSVLNIYITQEEKASCFRRGCSWKNSPFIPTQSTESRKPSQLKELKELLLH